MSDYVPPTFERSGSVSIEPLRNRHPGSTAYIVGKGPSLANIRASDFGPGPVITLNEAILNVQVLGLPNQIYAMQKDGCMTEDPYNIPRPCGTCEPLGWQRDPIVNPFPGVAAVFSQHLSSWCLHGRANRYVFTDAELGYEGYPLTMSVLEAIPFARHLGAVSIVMMCFDNFTKNELGSAYPIEDEKKASVVVSNLEWVQPRVLAALEGIPHSFFTPSERPEPLPIRRMLSVIQQEGAA